MTPKRYFNDHLPEVLRESVEAHFERFSQVPIIVSFHVTGEPSEGAGRWTARLGPGGVQVIEGEMDEAPLLTLCTPLADWPLTHPRLSLWMERLTTRLPGWARPAWDEGRLARLSRFSGTITMTATDHATEGGARDLVAEIFLGAYAQTRPGGFGVSVSSQDYEAMLKGELRPVRAFGEGRIKITGEVVLGLKLLLAAR